MNKTNAPFLLLAILACWPLFTLGSKPAIYKSHGISRFDNLKYPAGFKHYDYANPDAPKGGEIRLLALGTFDTVNPYAINGLSPSLAFSFAYLRYGFSEFNEPLMVGSGTYSPSGDEIKSAYGLIAESVEYPDDNRWITFYLHPEARFHDGHPVTADDVVFSFNILKKEGHPRYRTQLQTIDHVKKLSNHSVRFTFQQAGNRTQLFRAAELPVLPEHYWKDKPLGRTTLTPGLNSGPYKVTDIQPGASITYTRVKDYWGKDLPVNKGRYNFDKAILYFYRDPQAGFESFKAHGHDVHVEIRAKLWKTAYDFPAINNGSVKKMEIPHKLSVGSTFFYFNTRQPPFDNLKVRQAFSQMFDFEWTRKAIFHDSYKRTASYFPNSVMAASGTPSEKELELLMPWKHQLPARLFTEPFKNPVTKGDGNIREQQHTALALLKEAGWELKKGKLVNTKTNKPMTFVFLDDTSGSDRYLLAYKKNLAQIGIDMIYKQVEASQFYRQIKALDFGMVEQTLPQLQSPDEELMGYFHSSTVYDEGVRNLSGIQNPVVDHLVAQVPEAKTLEDMKTIIHSLDRVLMWNYYGIPKWHCETIRVAYYDEFDWPETAPLFTPPFSTWWRKNR